MISQKTNTLDMVELDRKATLQTEKEEFKQIFSDLMKTALKKAKTEENYEIFLLANISILKYIPQAFEEQFNSLMTYMNDYMKYYEKLHGYMPENMRNIIQKMSDIKKLRNTFYRDIMSELMDLMQWVYKADLNSMIASLFGNRVSFPEEFFLNPLLQTNNVWDETVMMDKYILLGCRSDDPDRYESLINVLTNLFWELDRENPEQEAIHKESVDLPSIEKDLTALVEKRSALLSSQQKLENRKISFSKEKQREQLAEITAQLDSLNKEIGDIEPKYKAIQDGVKVVKDQYNEKIGKWISHVENMTTLFDYLNSHEEYKKLKKTKKESKEVLRQKKNLIKSQKELFDFVYDKLHQLGLIQVISASYEILSIAPKYCPPINPRQLKHFILNPKERKKILDQLKRFFPEINQIPLFEKVKQVESLNKQLKKKYVIRFLKDFARFYRDMKNYQTMINLMDNINLHENENVLKMSRANRTLYEIVLPDEEKGEEQIISHVVLKADVRGSTKITLLMKERKLNPASHFSINFFTPITEILSIYGATKIFVEGDALILALFEKTGSQNWYSVARASGLAQHILRIIKNYNGESIKNDLPILELGIGICYQDSPPTFLFDGDHQIIISPALNLSDRLSSCSKKAREFLAGKHLPFNVYVFQSGSDEDFENGDIDERLDRFNVNGIELNEEGFVKLSKEISLRCFELTIPSLWNEKTLIYAGRFPTLTGSYQNLFVREARIARVNPANYHFIEWTAKRYFEVCINPKIIEFMEKKR